MGGVTSGNELAVAMAKLNAAATHSIESGSYADALDHVREMLRLAAGHPAQNNASMLLKVAARPLAISAHHALVSDEQFSLAAIAMLLASQVEQRSGDLAAASSAL